MLDNPERLKRRREYERQWRERNPTYMKDYRDAIDPTRIARMTDAANRRELYGRQSMNQLAGLS